MLSTHDGAISLVHNVHSTHTRNANELSNAIASTSILGHYFTNKKWRYEWQCSSIYANRMKRHMEEPQTVCVQMNHAQGNDNTHERARHINKFQPVYPIEQLRKILL